jgi:signal transduction histidine kinase
MAQTTMSQGSVAKPRPNRRPSIGTYLVGLLSVQTVLIAGLIGYSAVHDFSTSSHRAEGQAVSSARLAAQTVQKALSDNINQLQVQADVPGYDTIFKFPQSCSLTGNNDDFLGSDISIVRPDGTVACSSLRGAGGVPGPGYGQFDWYDAAQKGTQPFTYGPLDDPVTKHYAFLIGVPIQGGGALLASYRLDATGRGLDERLGITNPRPTFLITTADRTQVVTRSTPVSQRSLEDTPFAARLTGPGVKLRGLDGVTRFYAETSIRGTGWHVISGISTADAFADARRSLRDRSVLGILMMIIMLGAAVVIQRRFVRPVRSLSQATKRATEGDLDVRIDPNGPAEIADLAQNFNYMLRVRSEAETALKAAVTTEKDAADRLRELDNMKNSFLMAISHELRTPLTAVMGYATLLQREIKDGSPELLEDYAERIEISAQRLQRLMLDLLDFERMSRGVLEPHRQPTDLRQLVDRVIAQLEPDRNIKVEIPPGCEADIDPALLERVVENLVMNACKHTPPKTSIWVRTYKQRSKIVLAVEDSGRGVPKSIRTDIFEPFKQGDVPSHSPGTGVGLALVSQFAKLHGGRAWVQDRQGGGASFRVSVPPVSTKSGRRAAADDEFDVLAHA